MTGSAKQSSFIAAKMDCFVASAFARRRASADKSAPRNDVDGVLIHTSKTRRADRSRRRNPPSFTGETADYASLIHPTRFTADAAIKVTNDALQVFGAAGYSRNRPLERMVRDARMFTIGGGTAQILRTVEASRILGRKLPRTREGYLEDERAERRTNF
jgi:alkylation response protein AidB-like acyl-CoA dehydrogenase